MGSLDSFFPHMLGRHLKSCVSFFGGQYRSGISNVWVFRKAFQTFKYDH